jgi:hypothetical protein
MKKLKLAIAFSITTLALSANGTVVYKGFDQSGKDCELKIETLKVGPVKLYDACFFEIDGEGPWCDNMAEVAVHSIKAKGVFSTAAGVLPFQLEDLYSRANGEKLSFNGNSEGREIVSIDLDDMTGTASATFRTAYGKTLTGEQISWMLFHIPAGSSYEEISAKIYTYEKCVLRK